MKDNLERIVKSVILACMVMGVAFQVLIARDVVTPVSAIDSRQDITVYENSEYYYQQYQLKLSLSDKRARMMVNGYEVEGVAIGDHIDIAVYDGDVVEVDLRDCRGIVTAEVVSADKALKNPQTGYCVQGYNNILYLFKVEAE